MREPAPMPIASTSCDRTSHAPLLRLARLLLVGVPLLGACAAGLRTPVASADRPGYSYTTGTVPPGGAQLEAGYTDTRSGSLTYQTLGEGLLRIGAGTSTELRVFTNSYALRAESDLHTHGVEDAKLGVKQRLFAGKSAVGVGGTSVALMAGTSLPTGSGDFGADTWQPEALLAVTLPLSPKLALTTNVGDTYVKLGDDRSHRLIATLAGWYTLSSKLGTFAEYGGSQLASDARSRLHYVDAGLAFVPLPAIQLDIRAGHGMNGASNDNFVGVGITRRW